MRPRFSGVYIPLVTPFREGKLDREALARLIERLIPAGIAGLAPCGTTGESPTLSHSEHRQMIEWTVEISAGRVPVIAGSGSNCTAEAVMLTRDAEAAGADAVLVVCPYYNRPSQEGIIAHYRQVAACTRLPVIIYNIPKRTGVNIEPAAIVELSKVDNMVGMKQSSSDLAQTMEIIASTEEFSVLSGDDDMIFPICCLGGTGAIAASAHLLTAEWCRLPELVAAGRLDEARTLHYRLLPLQKALFMEPNPAGIKAALEMVGLPVGDPRMPLAPATERCRQALASVLDRLGALAPA